MKIHLKKEWKGQMSKMLLCLALLALGVTSLRAQGPDTFTIGTGITGNYVTSSYYPNPKPLPANCTSQNPYCGVPITGWDGEQCPGPSFCSGNQAGTVQLTAQPTVAGILIPQQFGYPNNGFLEQDCTLVYGPAVYTKGNGLNLGDTWSYSGNANCTGYAQGVTFSVTINYQVTKITPVRFGGKVYTYTLTGGSGTVEVQ